MRNSLSTVLIVLLEVANIISLREAQDINAEVVNAIDTNIKDANIEIYNVTAWHAFEFYKQKDHLHSKCEFEHLLHAFTSTELNELKKSLFFALPNSHHFTNVEQKNQSLIVHPLYSVLQHFLTKSCEQTALNFLRHNQSIAQNVWIYRGSDEDHLFIIDCLSHFNRCHQSVHFGLLDDFIIFNVSTRHSGFIYANERLTLLYEECNQNTTLAVSVGIPVVAIILLCVTALIVYCYCCRKQPIESEHEDDEDVVPESLIENARKAEPTISQKDKYLPENYDATQFNFKGPLMIHHRLNFTPVHELDSDPPREPAADDHFEFDSAMNEAYEIGEGVEQFVDEVKTNPSTEPLSNAVNQAAPGQEDALKEAAAIREAQRASLRSRSSSRTLSRNRLRSRSRSSDRHTNSKPLSKSRLRSGSRSPDRRSSSIDKNKRQKQYTSFRRIFTKDHGLSAANVDKTQPITQQHELPIQKTNMQKPLMTKLPPYRPYREVPTQSSLSLPIAPPITSSPPEREQATKSTIPKRLQTTTKNSSGTKPKDTLVKKSPAKETSREVKTATATTAHNSTK